MSSSCQPIKLATLYVRNLHVSITEGDLYDLFSSHGYVLSAKICRDHSTGVSRGYGYVKFGSLHDAMMATKLLNFKPLNGKHLRVMLSNRDSNLISDGTTIFFKNFARSLDNVTIDEFFSCFGTIVASALAIDSNGVSKGFGYVKFNHEEAAEKALRFNGVVVENSLVSVVPFLSKEDRDREKYRIQNYPTLYVENMSKGISDEEFAYAFSEFGLIAHTHVVRKKNGYGKGFGFVLFRVFVDAVSAIKGLNGKRASTIKYLDPICNPGDQVWYVGWANSMFRRDRPQSRHGQERDDIRKKLEGANLYIKNFGDNITEKTMKKMFSDFGMITSCKVMCDSQGISRGYGFVEFAAPEDATKAMNAMNGKIIGRKPLHVSVARRREEKKANLQMNTVNGKIIGKEPLDVPLAEHREVMNLDLQMLIDQFPWRGAESYKKILNPAEEIYQYMQQFQRSQNVQEKRGEDVVIPKPAQFYDSQLSTEVCQNKLLPAQQYMGQPLGSQNIQWHKVEEQSHGGTAHTRLSETHMKLPEVSEKAGQHMRQPVESQNVQWHKVGHQSPPGGTIHARSSGEHMKQLKVSEPAGQQMRRPLGSSQNIQWEKVGEQSHGTAHTQLSVALPEALEKAFPHMQQPVGFQNVQGLRTYPWLKL